MLIIETIILSSLFWGICYINTGNDEKNIKCYSSYPDEIQHMLKNNSKLSSKIKTSSPLLSFVSNILIYGVVLFLFGLMIRQDGFKSNFINMLILGQILNAFDFFIIDLVWWRNSKRIRFSEIENDPVLYHSSKKHFISFLKGVVLFFLTAMIDGFILGFC